MPELKPIDWSKWGPIIASDEPLYVKTLAALCCGHDPNQFHGFLAAGMWEIGMAAEFAVDEGSLKGIVRTRETSKVVHAMKPGHGLYTGDGKPLGQWFKENSVPVGVANETRRDHFMRPSVFFPWAKSKGYLVPKQIDRVILRRNLPETARRVADDIDANPGSIGKDIARRTGISSVTVRGNIAEYLTPLGYYNDRVNKGYFPPSQ